MKKTLLFLVFCLNQIFNENFNNNILYKKFNDCIYNSNESSNESSNKSSNENSNESSNESSNKSSNESSNESSNDSSNKSSNDSSSNDDDDSSESESLENKSQKLIKTTINFVIKNLGLNNDSKTYTNDDFINAGLNLIKLNVDDECFDFLFDIFSFNHSISFFSEAIFDSGLSSDDMGIEDYCIEKMGWYYAFTYFNVKEENSTDELKKKITEFLEIDRMGKSFCLWKNCSSLYPFFLNHSKNIFYYNDSAKQTINDKIELLKTKFPNKNFTNINLSEYIQFNKVYEFNLSMIGYILGISNITLVNENYLNNQTNKTILNYKDIQKYKSSINKVSSLFTFLIIYFIIRLIISLIFFKINSSTEDENSIDKEELMKQIQRTQYSYNNEEKSVEEDRHYLTKKKNLNDSICYKICSSLSLFYNFANINEDKNLIYNENHLNVISGIKVFLLFFMFLAQNSFMIIKTTEQYTLLKTFLSSFYFFIIKIGVLAVENYKIISGCLFGFKLISYYHNHRNLTVSEIIKFYIKCVPYIFSFFIIFAFLQKNLLYIGLAVKDSIHFQFIGETYYDYDCTKDVFSILNPFNLYKSGYTCYTFAFFLISEFYSFNILFILVITCLKLKKALIEYAYFIIFGFMAIFLFLFLYPVINDSSFKISEIYGNIYLTRYPHIFLIFYFIGFNIGIMYYYHVNYSETYNEYNEKLINSNKNIYMPFYLDYKIMLFLSKKKGLNKNIILIISFILYILVSLDFNLLILIYYDRLSQPKKFLISKDFFINFIYIYDGLISSIFFCLTVLMLLLRNEYSLLNKIIGSKFFIVFNRTSFTFLITSNFVIGYFYCSNYIDIYLNVRNVFSTTIPLFIINFLLSIILIILIEIPIKYLIRAITGKSMLNK